MLNELVTRFQFPVPEAFVQQQIEARLDRGLRALAQQGMKVEDMRKLRLRTASLFAARSRRQRGEGFDAAGTGSPRPRA